MAVGDYTSCFVFTLTPTALFCDTLTPTGVGFGSLMFSHQLYNFIVRQAKSLFNSFEWHTVSPSHQNKLLYVFFRKVFFHNSGYEYCTFLTLPYNTQMRKVWNRPNQAVWSLVTQDKDSCFNMNICTYVTSVSIQPKMMLIAVYHHTKTLENIKANPNSPILLQLLSEPLAPVVRICGQQSGNDIDKIARLEKRFTIATYHKLPYFADAAAVLLLENLTLQSFEGDHDLLIGTVTWSKNLHDVSLLTTDYLKTHKYIR